MAMYITAGIKGRAGCYFSSASTKDLILFNRGGGRSFRVVAAPSRRGGKADDVVPIDHDANGLTDFLALNGGSSRGPVQLISFYR
jgi:hypothetical protein